MRGMRPVPRSFYRHDASVVAAALLNKLLVVGSGERVGRIVEVEAYRGSEDPGSHAYRGLTRRNATMFGPPGHLYVYFSYGMHWCANVVCLDEGVPHAVLLRALAPVSGVASMRTARAQGQKRPVSDRDLCRGPGRLCQALGVTGAMNGADLVSGTSGAGGAGDRFVRVTSDGTPPPAVPGVSVRIGLSAQRGADLPLRFFVPGDRYVSGRLAD
jgi:DNA-3-methyladenine glycosylase